MTPAQVAALADALQVAVLALEMQQAAMREANRSVDQVREALARAVEQLPRPIGGATP